jgi:hypothetical protein
VLITNFAAGELSKTLFGRIDLPQYYQGAARMENFDVIPTGGVKRRSGTQRLLSLGAAGGRIIPFMVNRGLGFLLYLTHQRITAYKLVNGQISNSQVFNSGYQLADTGDVHYAQNYDTMILCHEKHQPLQIKFNMETETLTIEAFSIDLEVDVIINGEINIDKQYDEKYQENDWLQNEGQWPRCATFFGGRLVFAGTRASPQRLFFSGAGDPKKFATYKRFITAEKKYVVLEAKVKINSKEAALLTPGDIGKFKKPLTEYYVDSPYFSEGASVAGLNNGKLLIDSPKIMQFNEYEIAQFLAWKNGVEANNGWSGSQTYATVKFRKDVYVPARPGTGQYDPGEPAHWSLSASVTLVASIKYKKTGQLHFYAVRTTARAFSTEPDQEEIAFDEEFSFSYDLNLVERCVQNRNALYDYWIESRLPYYLQMSYPQNVENEVRFARLGSENIEDLNTFFDNFHEAIQTGMHYPCVVMGVSQDLYGTPAQMLLMMLTNFNNRKVNASLSFYTREIIADDSYPTPDCGFTFEIASDANDAIRWLALNKGLIVGTETGEWIIPPGVHATNIQAALNSRYGSDKIQGTAVGDATCFFQAGKKGLVEYYIPQQDANFRANNMALLSPEMLGESDALEFDYILSPHTKLLITRDDGAMAALLYERGTGTFAWSRITTGPERSSRVDAWRKKRLEVTGQIKSAAVLPGPDGNDDAYLIVERNNVFYLERLREGGDVYLDSYVKVNKNEPWAAQREAYGADGAGACRIYTDGDGVLKYEALDADAAPDMAQAGDFYIGYLYTSVLRTMPVLANNQMKKQRVVNLAFRFLDSYLPRVTSIAAGYADKTDVPGGEQPFSGVFKQPFPGTWGADVQAEVSTDDPAPVTILALNAEMEGAQ